MTHLDDWDVFPLRQMDSPCQENNTIYGVIYCIKAQYIGLEPFGVEISNVVIYQGP